MINPLPGYADVGSREPTSSRRLRRCQYFPRASTGLHGPQLKNLRDYSTGFLNGKSTEFLNGMPQRVTTGLYGPLRASTSQDSQLPGFLNFTEFLTLRIPLLPAKGLSSRSAKAVENLSSGAQILGISLTKEVPGGPRRVPGHGGDPRGKH